MNKIYSGTDNLDVMACANNYNNFLIRLVTKNIGISDTVLDFGAGTGTFVSVIKPFCKKMIAIELDESLRARLSSKKINCYSSLSEVKTASVNFVYTLNVLEHIEDDQSSLNEIFKIIQPGGKLLIYVPAFMCLYSSMDEKVGHYRRYRRSNLIAKVKNAGFEVEFSKYADSLGFFFSLLYKAHKHTDGTVNIKLIKIYDKYFFPLSLLMDIFLNNFLGKNLIVLALKR